MLDVGSVARVSRRQKPAEQSEGGKDHAEQKRDGSVIVTNDNRHIYPQTTKEERKKPNWVEKGTLFVLTLTLIAAGYAGFEAHRLAEFDKKSCFRFRKDRHPTNRRYCSIA